MLNDHYNTKAWSFCRFNDVFVESGVLLVHPLLNKASADKTEIYSNIAATVTKETLAKMVKKKKKRIDDLMELPSVLEGRAALKSPLDRESLWNAQVGTGYWYSYCVFMPPDRMIGGILFLSCLFVCLSTLTFAITFEPKEIETSYLACILH